jgi:hypothetical protein
MFTKSVWTGVVPGLHPVDGVEEGGGAPIAGVGGVHPLQVRVTAPSKQLTERGRVSFTGRRLSKERVPPHFNGNGKSSPVCDSDSCTLPHDSYELRQRRK